MNLIKLILLVIITIPAMAQNWSTFLDTSRAVDWTSAGFTIPNYTVNCATQPTLATGSGAAASNSTAIQNALNSCDATHNVVNLPSGTYYVTKVSFGTQGKQVLRGNGSNQTFLIATTGVGCGGGLSSGLCLKDSVGYYDGSGPVQPGGSNACSWTGGYTKGTTLLTFGSCGSAPPIGQTIILDQANDITDTGGVYNCDTNITNCGYESNTGGNNNGRSISGKTYSQQQITKVTAVTSLGGGGYNVTVSPGVYFTNIRSGQTPGAWWPGFVQNVGVENFSIDGSAIGGGSNISLYNCYNCWVKGVRSMNAGRNHVDVYQSSFDVIRDSYFFGSQGSGSDSYAVEFGESSGILVENNIFQQVTTPTMFGAGTGSVIGYNYAVNVNYTCGGGCPSFGNGAYASHNAGNNMNLFEGNNFYGIWGDDAWGSANENTYFRNMLTGWQPGKSNSTFPIMLRAYMRDTNIIGNVMGQPSYHTQYQAIATSTSGGTGAAGENTSIYSIGWAGTGATCSSGFVSQCDPLGGTTLMRWGNWDTVNNSTQWSSTEASPAANTYVNANFTSGYFTSLAHTLPASFYYSTAPSWWPAGKNWPLVGPDVTTGNVGTCSGTYSGAQGTLSAQCSAGTLTNQWAAHVTSSPAQDCYLNQMGGPPDGSGSVLAFNGSTCYNVTSSTVATPTFAVPAGSYPSAQSVTISTATPGASLYYTLDGTTPVLPPTSPSTSIFSISTTASSNDPVPFPPINRCCIGTSWDKIETARGTYSNTAFNSVDAWVAKSKANGSETMFSGVYTPNWASGVSGVAGLAKPPTDLNTMAFCQAPYQTTVQETNCMFKEYYTKFMQHICHVTIKPSSPLIGVCDIRYHEVRNEFNVGKYWTGTTTQLAKLANDQAIIIRQYCGDCIVVGGSASAGGSGTGGAYTSALLSFLTAWGTQTPFSPPNKISYHAYPTRTTVKPVPFPTSIVQHNFVSCSTFPGDASCICQQSNTPNSSCTVAIMNQTPTLKSSVMCSSAITSWACGLGVISTEGFVGHTEALTDGVDGNSANSTFLRKAYTIQYMIVLQGSGTEKVLVYNWDDPCWMPFQSNTRTCSGLPNFPPPLGMLPWQASFVKAKEWLQNTTFTGTSPVATTVSGGTIYTWNITHNGIPAQFAWFDGWLSSTSYTPPGGTLYAETGDGVKTAVSGPVTLTQLPTLLTAGTTFLYTTPINVASSLTIKSIGIKSGMTNSALATAPYSIGTPTAAADPVFSPVGGTYTGTQNVGITSATPSAVICVTNDGSTPTTSGPGACSHGTPYTGLIPVSATTTLKALATKVGFLDSNVITSTYTITIPTVADPVFSPPGGTYGGTQTLTITSTTPGAVKCYTEDGSTPTGASGACTHGTTYLSPFAVSSSETVKAIAIKAGSTDSNVVTAVYSITVAAPTFTPPPGGYGAPQTVTINDSTPGVTICFTLDGSTPAATVPGTCSTGTAYTTPIYIGGTTTLKAMATKASNVNSTVTTGVYSINIPPVIVSGTWTFKGNIVITVNP